MKRKITKLGTGLVLLFAGRAGAQSRLTTTSQIEQLQRQMQEQRQQMRRMQQELESLKAQQATEAEHTKQQLQETVQQVHIEQEPQVVTDADRSFVLHQQAFVFGTQELAGLKLFLAEPESTSGSAGNCIACHHAPNFTDFAFHNAGASQEEYDAIHGQGAFAALQMPDLTTWNADLTAFLPPTAAHPTATGRFAAPPAVDQPGFTDLGLWNVFANPDQPASQTKLEKLLTRLHGEQPTSDVLNTTSAAFKTPGLRDLGQSAPYLHTGGKDTLSDVIQFYIAMANGARAR